MKGKPCYYWIVSVALILAISTSSGQTVPQADRADHEPYPGGMGFALNYTVQSPSADRAVSPSPLGSTPRLLPQGVRHRVPQDYETIQAAIDASADGDTILVSEGTYSENIRYRGKAIVVASLYLIDADIAHIATTVIDGSNSSIADSGSVVYFVEGEDTTSVLTGFTIQGGTGTRLYWNSTVTGTFWERGGGGIFCYNAGARITRNIITRNRIIAPIAQGGGIDAVGTGAWYPFIVLEGNQITDNYLQGTSSGNMEWSGGGGVALFGVEARVVENAVERDTIIGNMGSFGAGLAFLAYTTGRWPNGEIMGNVVRSNVARSTYQGAVGTGMIIIFSGQVNVERNLIEGNQGTSTGASGWAQAGGISVEDGVLTESRRKTIADNRFVGNTVNNSRVNDGAGMGVYNAVCTITGNEFRENAVLGAGNVYDLLGPGGGAVCVHHSFFRIENNIFTQNTTIGEGGALNVAGLPQTGVEQLIINNTIVDNHAALRAGAMRLFSPQTVVVRNTIFWGDSAQTAPEIYTGGAVADIMYCDVRGGWPGVGNINEDPSFSLPQLDALKADSPCISAGTLVNSPSTDIHGHSRPQPAGSYPDLGAEESPLARTTAPLPTLPLPNATLVSRNPTFVWLAVLNASHYRLHIASDSVFTSMAVDTVILHDTTCELTTELAPETDYFWRLYAWNDTDTSAKPSTARRFTTGPTAIELMRKEAPTMYALEQNYPNPFNPTTGIRYQVPRVSDVKITMYDILGREVAVLVNERKASGRYEVSFDASGLASGVYIYRLTAGPFTQSRSMILQK